MCMHTHAQEKKRDRKKTALKDLSQGGKQGQQEHKLWQNSSIYKQKCVSSDSQLVNLLMNGASLLLKQAERVPTPIGLVGDTVLCGQKIFHVMV